METGNERKTNSTSCRDAEKMEWDITVIDRLLHLVTPIILLVCAVVLMLVVKLPGDPQKTISCVAPQEFSNSQILFAHRTCLSENALLVKSPGSGQVIAPDDYENMTVIKVDSIFPPKSARVKSDFSTPLFLMAILSLLPLLCWRLVGSVDGRDFLVQYGQPSTSQTASLALWFLITKVGAVALCIWFVVQTIALKVQTFFYMRALDYNQQPDSVSVLCRFSVQRLGQNLHRYIIPCDISKDTEVQRSYVYLLVPIINSLHLWLMFLLITFCVYLLCNIVLFIWCSMRSNRIDFIKRNTLCNADDSIYNKMEQRLGTTGFIVFTLASKLGYGDKVRAVLSSFCEKNMN